MKKNSTKKISEILNSLPDWNRWNNYKDIFDTEKITRTFLETVLIGDEKEKILDFGAGFAINEYIGKDYNLKIDSLDIDTPEVRSTFRKVHEGLGLKTYLYDGKTIPFKDNSYNKIIFKASITKMRQSDPLSVFSELLRVSAPGATWYVSPPYMWPRFVEMCTHKFGENWVQGKDNVQLLNQMIEKNVQVVVNDWVKRSTFAFGSEELMGSYFGWMSQNTYDFDALRRNHKHGYAKGVSYPVNTYPMVSQFIDILKSAFDAKLVKFPHEAAHQAATKDWKCYCDLKDDFYEKMYNLDNNVRLSVHAKANSLKMKKTYIFARGKSAGWPEENTPDAKASKDDTVIYVNDWKKLLTRYFYSNFSEESINIHFVNRDLDLNLLSSRQYFDKTFAVLQTNSEINEKSIRQKVSEFCYGSQMIYASIPTGLITTPVKTAGLHAVFYAVKVLKRKDIEIFGLDFFEANYLTEHVVSKKPEPQEYQPAKGKIAKEQFVKLVQENPEVKFKIHTYADFTEVKYDNLEVNQLKE